VDVKPRLFRSYAEAIRSGRSGAPLNNACGCSTCIHYDIAGHAARHRVGRSKCATLARCHKNKSARIAICGSASIRTCPHTSAVSPTTGCPRRTASVRRGGGRSATVAVRIVCVVLQDHALALLKSHIIALTPEDSSHTTASTGPSVLLPHLPLVVEIRGPGSRFLPGDGSWSLLKPGTEFRTEVAPVVVRKLALPDYVVIASFRKLHRLACRDRVRNGWSRHRGEWGDLRLVRWRRRLRCGASGMQIVLARGGMNGRTEGYLEQKWLRTTLSESKRHGYEHTTARNTSVTTPGKETRDGVRVGGCKKSPTGDGLKGTAARFELRWPRPRTPLQWFFVHPWGCSGRWTGRRLHLLIPPLLSRPPPPSQPSLVCFQYPILIPIRLRGCEGVVSHGRYDTFCLARRTCRLRG